MLNINSYDLKGRNKNTFQSPASPNRLHTDWWKFFWKTVSQSKEKIFTKEDSSILLSDTKRSKNNETKQENNLAFSHSFNKILVNKIIKDFNFGKIRLNPEVKIRYRKADEDLKKYFLKRQFSNSFKHRGLKEQWTAQFTLALNAGEKYDELAFVKPEDILKKIQDFNKKFNQKKNFKITWQYGIDRGQKELATLCLVKFNPQDTYKLNGKTLLKPKFPNDTEKCYTLKKYNYSEDIDTKKEEKRKHYAIKNLSYFVDDKNLNNKELFKKENVSCLDLTTAKVIKGNIITNGDILTYLKLKKTGAKRQLYELYQSGKIIQETKLEWSEWENNKINNEERYRPDAILNIKTSSGEKTIYWYIKKYEGIPLKLDKQGNIQIAYNKRNIQNALNSYLNQLRQNNTSHTPSIEQINHLRDAITANMVGVICHLQKTYPGFVILEDLSKGQINRHFFNNNENIARRLEYALYNKFQTLGLIPPHVKNIIQLREDISASKSGKNKKKQNDSENNTNKLSQIGSIIFVDEKYTSTTCPYCENQCKKELKIEKFKQNRFRCEICGFDTYFFKHEEKINDYCPKSDENQKKKEFELFKDLNDNDKVAAYNIAKRSLKQPN